MPEYGRSVTAFIGSADPVELQAFSQGIVPVSIWATMRSVTV
jgi:hypothetical protein